MYSGIPYYADQQARGREIEYITDREVNWYQLADEKRPFFLKAGARWCGPCRAVAPAYRDVASMYSGRANFMEVDVDDVNVDSLNIQSLPTFIYFPSYGPSEYLTTSNAMELQNWVAANLDPRGGF